MFNTMLSNDIRQTLDHFRRSVDRLFEDANAPARSTGETARPEWTFSPAVETAWTDHELLLRAIVPGVAEKDLRVSVQGSQLLLEGERRQPENFGRNGWTHLTYGKFQTAVTLPNGLDLEKVNCRLHDGVLDIRVPIAESMKPRQIQIETGGERKALGA
jgi:HSP20 family protein